MVQLLLHVDVEERLVSVAPAPEHEVGAAELVREVERGLGLFGGECKKGGKRACRKRAEGVERVKEGVRAWMCARRRCSARAPLGGDMGREGPFFRET